MGAGLKYALSLARVFWLVLLLVTPRFAIAQESTVAKSYFLARPFAGCYELRVPAWDEARAKQNDLLPTRFQLTLQLDRPIKERRFVAQNLDSKVHYYLTSGWKANSDGTLDLFWGTGFVGYTIQLTGSARELRGTALYWTDTDPIPPVQTNRNTVTVVANRVECRASAN